MIRVPPSSIAFALLCAIGAPALAQTVKVFEKPGGMKDMDCAKLKDALGGGQTRTACYPPRSGPALRCSDVKAETVDDFCRQAQGDLNKGALDRVAAIVSDLEGGKRRPGGRRADEDRCPVTLPQDELLLPGDKLVFEPADAGAQELRNVTLKPAAGGAPVFNGATVAGRTEVDAAALRGKTWLLEGRGASGPFACKFKVLPAGEAQPLAAEYSALQSAGTAGLIEQAAFFRKHQFWTEYWRAIEALRRL